MNHYKRKITPVFIDQFNQNVLSENCWTDHFYVPQVKVQEIFLQQNSGNKSAVEFITCQRHETELYYKYKEYYGYVFYIGKKL